MCAVKLVADRVELLTYMGLKDKRCAEIGVHLGQYSKEILKQQPAHLMLVDPWLYCDDNKSLMMNTSQDDYDKRYKAVCKQLGQHEHVSVVRATSEAAALDVSDETLDFAYVDGNHEYRFVLLDLFTWWPKIVSGGWLAGHDLVDNRKFSGVLRAYKLFLQYVDPLDIVHTDEKYSSYAIRKR